MILPFVTLALLSGPVWSKTAPSKLPPVTVRWEDPGQQDIVAVEGARYQCRVGTLPAKVLSLSVDGKELLGPNGITFAVLDAQGRRLVPAPASVKPDWTVWRGQRWQPATSSRARMNVWSASPYYHDCHILDIPLLTEEDAAKYTLPEGPPLKDFDPSANADEFKPLHHVSFGKAGDGAFQVALTGDDPYLLLPPVDVQGPIRVKFKLRSSDGGGAAVYWATKDEPGISGNKVVTFGVSGDNEWHEYDVNLDETGRINQLRFDPPGESGTMDMERIELLKVAGGSGLPKPVRGELVFHAQPDRLAIEMRIDPLEGQPAPKAALFQFDGKTVSAGNASGRWLATLGEGISSAVILGPPKSKWSSNPPSLPLTGTRPGTWLVLRPSTKSTPVERMAEELKPFPAISAKAEDGYWRGYDPIAGFYVADMCINRSAFSFDATFNNPTRRSQLDLTLRNNALPRNMLVKVQTGEGNLEAGVLTDLSGFMLPVAAFVSKNFAGEMEEPDDTAFGDIYFPMMLNGGETKRFKVEPLTHGWGIWPLKQISSIRFFLIYWHCSTGASESTCWSMDWMPTKGAIFEIPDFRPMSGPFWAGQPQHDCQHWPGWLQYNQTKGRLCYERTVFDSIAPSMARFTMLFHTTDRTANARVEAYEAPQKDEMRTMLHLRYDWVKPCVIEGDARRNFRWLNMNHFRGRNETLLWTGPDGKTVLCAIPPKDDFVMLGKEMSPESPFMASEGPIEKYGVLTLVRSFKARLGGKIYDCPAISAAFDAKDASSWLTVNETNLQLQPGDYLEADVMLMPHGEPSPLGFKAERERKRFGLDPVKIAVNVGEKIADYPPQVKAKEDVAAFRLSGGHGDLPLIVEGLSSMKVPLLWTNGVWQDHQVHGGDGYQIQPDGNGGYRVTFVAPHRDGQSYDFMVTQASCTGDIACMTDRNGRLELRAASPGHWQLKAPESFGPGVNRIDPKRSFVEFSGDGGMVRQLPLSVTPLKGPVEVAVTSWELQRIVMRVGGTADIVLGDLKPGGSYVVKVGTKADTVVATEGTIKVHASGAATVEITAK